MVFWSHLDNCILKNLLKHRCILIDKTLHHWGASWRCFPNGTCTEAADFTSQKHRNIISHVTRIKPERNIRNDARKSYIGKFSNRLCRPLGLRICSVYMFRTPESIFNLEWTPGSNSRPPPHHLLVQILPFRKIQYQKIDLKHQNAT